MAMVPSTPAESVATVGDADMVTADEAMGTRCCTCKRPVDEHNSLVIVRASQKTPECRRCKNCHNVRGAIQRLSSKNGNLVKDFSKVDGDRLQSFYEQFSHLRGEDLRTKVEETVTQWKTQMTRFEFDQNVQFMDEEDLKLKYADRPTTLENILKNGKRFFCPVKQQTLYGDPKYSANVKDVEEHGTTEKRKGAVALKEDEEPNTKKTKKASKKIEAGAAGSAPEECKLKAGEKKKLGKKADGAETKTVFLKDLVDKAKAYGDMIPGYVVEAANHAVLEATQIIQDVRAKCDSGKGDVQPMMDSLTAQFDKVGEATARLKSQVDAAANFK